MVRVGAKLGLGSELGLGLGASKSFIAECWQGNPEDWLPVAGRRYTTKNNSRTKIQQQIRITKVCGFCIAVFHSGSITPGFQHYVAVSVKTVSVPAFP